VPHGSVSIGDITVTALCDDVREGPWSLDEAFPDVGNDEWPQIEQEHPETVATQRMWRAHDHCFLVRAPGRTILVDTGIGPRGTAVADLLHPEGGALLDELERAGARAEEVDLVVLTHMHFDHIGWNVSGPNDDPRPTFSNARYVLQASEWDAYASGDDDPQGGPARARQVRWLREADILDLVDGQHEIASGTRVLATPGHTAGSQSVVVTVGDEHIVIAGDVANHPLQVTRPDRRSFADADPDSATTTRRELFQRVERAGAVVATAHFADPFGRISGGSWVPIQPGGSVPPAQ
jgi:glyoxylase-like metal-dependent hydrolase (beta-lactamase superfamily II)